MTAEEYIEKNTMHQMVTNIDLLLVEDAHKACELAKSDQIQELIEEIEKVKGVYFNDDDICYVEYEHIENILKSKLLNKKPE